MATTGETLSVGLPSEVNCSSCSFELTETSGAVTEIHIYSATNVFEKSITILDTLSEIFGIVSNSSTPTSTSLSSSDRTTADMDNLKLARDAGVRLVMCSKCAEILSTLYKDFLTLIQISAATGYVSNLLRHMDTWQKKYLSESVILHNEEEMTILEHDPIVFDTTSEINEDQADSHSTDHYNLPEVNEHDLACPETSSSASPVHPEQQETNKPKQGTKRKRQKTKSQSVSNKDMASNGIQKKYRDSRSGPPGSGPTRHFFRCPHCPKSFFYNWEVLEHSLLVHDGKEQTCCGKCGWEYFPEVFMADTHKCPTSDDSEEEESPALISCQVCNAKFRTASTLKQHLDTAHVVHSVKIECVICHKNCIRRSSLLQHYFLYHPETHHGENHQWQCSHCGMTFGEECDLSNHTTTTHAKELEERPEVCNFCPKRFPDQEGKSAHMRHAHGYHKRTKQRTSPNDFPCDLCGKGFISSKRLRRHKKCQHGRNEEKKNQCNICAKRFWTGHKLKMHMGIHTHGTNSNTTIPNEFKEYDLKYNCKFCPVTFNYKAHMDLHNRNFHPTKEICHTCSVCSAKFPSNLEFRIHIRKHMTPEERKRNNWSTKAYNGEFDCDICLKTYNSLKNLSTHHNFVHVDNASINCEICHKGLRARNLTYHYKTFHPEKHAEMEKAALEEESSRVPEKLTCDICNNGKTYASRFSFLQHKGIHDGTCLKVTCLKCGQKVRSNHLLKQHDLRLHSDGQHIPPVLKRPKRRKLSSPTEPKEEGKFVCTVCNKGKLYASLKTLKEHQLIHTEAHLKFSCYLCGHRVRRESHLRAHMKSAHPPKIREDYHDGKRRKSNRRGESEAFVELASEENPDLVKTEGLGEEVLGFGEEEDSFFNFYMTNTIERKKRLEIRLTRINERVPYFSD